MPKIIKNGLEYSGTPLEEVTAWPPTGDSIQIEQPLMGSTDISEVGDGTVTGAIAQNAEDITELNNGLTVQPVSVTSQRSGTTLTARKVGGIIEITGNTTNIPRSAWTSVGFCEPAYAEGASLIPNSDYTAMAGVRITQAGEILVYQNNAATASFYALRLLYVSAD